MKVLIILAILLTPMLLSMPTGTALASTENHSSFIWMTSTDDFVYKRSYSDFSDTGISWDTLYGYPSGLEYLPENNRIYVTDLSDELICYTIAGVKEWSYNIGAFSGDAYGLARANDYWWIVDRGDDKVYKVDNGGQYIADFGRLGGKGSFATAEGAAWDGNYLWIADEGSAVIYAFDISTVTTGSHVLTEVASFTITGCTAPTGLAFDGTYFWVSDSDQDYVWKVESDGTIVGGPWAFTNPEGLAYDPTAAPEWRLIDNWTGTIKAQVMWQLIDTWTGTLEAFTGWQLLESWSGTILIPFGEPSLVRPIEDQPYFVWLEEEAADNYRLLIDNNIDFSSPTIDVTLTDTFYWIPEENAIENGIWYWKVIATGPDWELESDVWSFTVGTTVAEGDSMVLSLVLGLIIGILFALIYKRANEDSQRQ